MHGHRNLKDRTNFNIFEIIYNYLDEEIKRHCNHVPVHNVRVGKRGGVTAPFIFDLGVRWEWLASRPDHFAPANNSGSHLIERWAGRRVSSEVSEGIKIACTFRDPNQGPSGL